MSDENEKPCHCNLILIALALGALYFFFKGGKI